ncbi:DHHC zinc finger domain-containing protein [Cardiosporidium cionae]|uniref:Palmitoyltransferase n=1 Tax=Cardiosporidium cionae TaxID=476202 RepID=A0ABQ7J5W2_9APIC|nr:DHHC zinc finger domain-containing protein [Cardiosporidium cionae]|eukprot:KAF8819395.1 DHHC zinc finger domain-containing protein [Cardiosporidium cionae]
MLLRCAAWLSAIFCIPLFLVPVLDCIGCGTWGSCRVERCTRKLKWVMRRIYGPRMFDSLLRLLHYIFYTNNCIGQIFYCIVAVGSSCFVVILAYIWLPYSLLGIAHRLGWILTLSIGLMLFVLCASSNPGYIAEKQAQKFSMVYDTDKELYSSDRECSTCLFTKPARTKHCRFCNRCVARFDHHCCWIGNCIGAGNHRYFLLFLAWHTLQSLYGLLICATILMDIIQTKRLRSAIFIEGTTGKRFQATFLIIVQYLVVNHAPVMVCTLMAILFAIFLMVFTSFHIYATLIKNFSTNECFKMRRQSWKESKRGNKNLYNKGFVENCYEIFFWESWCKEKYRR